MTCLSKMLPSITTYPSTDFIFLHCNHFYLTITSYQYICFMLKFAAKCLTTGSRQGGVLMFTFANFRGINTPTKADFKQPT